MGPKFSVCLGVMSGLSNTPIVAFAVSTCSRGFAFSGVGVAMFVESATREVAVVGAGAGLDVGSGSSETEVRGRDSEESRIWLHICDFRSEGIEMRLYDSSRLKSGRLMVVDD